MNQSTEIRKLTPSYVRELVHILEDANSWKKLMEIIPKRLEKDNYECNYTEDNPQKYHSEHFRLIERASRSYQRPCSEILLDEWGTSGRVRPSLGHLLNLLKRAELYRAADFVAIDLLKSNKPQRPKDGPAAQVHVTFLLDDRRGEVEEVLENVRCDSSDIRNLNNRRRNSSSNTIDNNIEVNLPAQRKVVQLVNPIQHEVSDMIKFSHSIEDNADIPNTQSDAVPNISFLLHSETTSNIPQISTKVDEKENSCNVPQISALLTSDQVATSNDVLPQISALLNAETNSQKDLLPQLSALLSSDKENNSEILPQLSALMTSNSLLPQQIKDLLLSKRIDQYALVPQLSALISSSEEITPEMSKQLSSLSNDQMMVLLRSVLPPVNENGNFSGPQISQLLNTKTDEFTPQISQLLKSDGGDGLNKFTPTISKLLQSDVDDSESVATSPHLSALLNDKSVQHDSSLNGQSSEDFVPQISDLLENERDYLDGENGNFLDYGANTNSPPQISILLMDKSNTTNHVSPQISSLLSPNVILNDSPSTSNELPTLTSSSSGRPQCNSPLPNLSLNTILPHFNYQELELATSNFDETPHPKGRFLGSGAFGSVFLCLGLLEKPTAVKKLHLDGATEVNVNDTITKQFRNEVELLCSYKHDNLLSICGYSCDGPTYCIMYEYISGGALNYRLENQKEDLNWRDRIRIACGTADAVAYLHTAYSRKLIHRDIKTANILLDSANKPKLGDFGIIKLSPNKNTTVTTTIIGTSVYMAPECFRSGEVTEKTDTFSFGVVILELLTALPPLDENREARDLITHVEDMCDNNSIAPLLDLSAGSWMKGETNVAEELFKIANRCLGEKKHRPNMVEVADLINKLVST